MKEFVILSALSVLVVSCGKDGGAAAEEAVQKVEIQRFYGQSESGACGLDVVSDYNSAASECKNIYTEKDANSCRALFKKFLSKYPKINCSAESGYGLTKETVTINYSEIQNTINKLDEILSK